MTVPGLRRFVPGTPECPSPPPAPSAGVSLPTASPDQGGQEKCELCAVVIPAGHGHVADLHHASLLCTCRACYLLFTNSQAANGRYRGVPDRYLADPDRPLSQSDWDDLQVPVGLAFFLRSSQRESVSGFYPSPAGVTECQLDLAAWDRLAADHPLLAAMSPDVEAALVCRHEGRVEHFVVPVNVCYELAGRMRLHWHGFDGGTQARQAIADFIDRVRSRAVPLVRGA